MSKSPITCHVLDASLGKPATGVQVEIQRITENGQNVTIKTLATGSTDGDGRCSNLLPSKAEGGELPAGVYKVVFKTKDYFATSSRKCLYPFVEITFELEDPSQHYHIPLLISPFSYTTYRGS